MRYRTSQANISTSSANEEKTLEQLLAYERLGSDGFAEAADHVKD